MKLLFVITGIGLGHSLREKAIIDEIKKDYPETQIHIAGYGLSLNYFKKRYQTTEIKGHKFKGNTFRQNKIKTLLQNYSYPFNYMLDLLTLVRLIKRFNPDKVIVDMQPVGVKAANLAGKEAVSIYNLDVEKLKNVHDMHSKTFIGIIRKAYDKSGKVIIPTLTQQRSKRSNIYYINPIIRTNPDELASKQILMKKLRLKKEPILVTIGGSKFGISLIKDIIKIAEKFDENFIIFGMDYKSKNVTGYKFKNNFLEYLKVSKAVISTAGHNTLSELLVFKKPALIFPIFNYLEQHQNASMLKAANAAIVSNFTDDIERLELLIKKLLKEKDKIITNLNRLDVKGTGAKEAVDIIFD